MFSVCNVVFKVTDAIAPGYSTRIKSPMDLSTIKAKLPGYHSLAAMDADVRLMFRNCKDFNGPGALAKVNKCRVYRDTDVTSIV